MFRIPTHPHRLQLRLDADTRTQVANIGIPVPVVLRAAMLAAVPAEVGQLALSRATARTGRPTKGVQPQPRTGLRVCAICHERITVLAAKHEVTGAVAARALVADGLRRDWRAHIGQAVQGDLWER